jgi:hypothetical protein
MGNTPRFFVAYFRASTFPNSATNANMSMGF